MEPSTRHDRRASAAPGTTAFRLACNSSCDLQLDLVELLLAGIEQHQASGRVAQDLPHQLRADRAAGARHQDGLVRDVAGQQRRVRGHGIAPEQVFRLHRTQVADGHAALGQVLHRRQRPHADHQALELLQRRLPLLPPGLGHGQQHFADVVPLDEPCHALGAIDLEVGDVWPHSVGLRSTKPTGM